VIAYADNPTNLNLEKMIDFHKKIRSMGRILCMGLIKAPDPTACGIVTLDDHRRVDRFVEKPSHPESELVKAGVYITAAELFSACWEKNNVLCSLTGPAAMDSDI
jgi:NDP-sugar pyrophosphorylase family protein